MITDDNSRRHLSASLHSFNATALWTQWDASKHPADGSALSTPARALLAVDFHFRLCIFARASGRRGARDGFSFPHFFKIVSFPPPTKVRNMYTVYDMMKIYNDI